MARIETSSTSTIFAQKKDSPPGLWDPLAGLFKKKVPPPVTTPGPIAPPPSVEIPEIVVTNPEPARIPEVIQTLEKGVDLLIEPIASTEIHQIDATLESQLFENVEILPARGVEQLIQNVAQEVIPEVLLTPETQITAAVTVLTPLENPTTLPARFTRKAYPFLTLRNFAYLALLVTAIAFIYFVYKNLWQKKNISVQEPKPVLEMSQTEMLPEIQPITTQEIQLPMKVVQEELKSNRFTRLELAIAAVMGGVVGGVVSTAGYVLCNFFHSRKNNTFQQSVFRDAGLDPANTTLFIQQTISEKVKATTENAEYILKLTTDLKADLLQGFAEQIHTMSSNIQRLQDEVSSLQQSMGSLNADKLFKRMDALEKSDQTLQKLREELQRYVSKEEYEKAKVSTENRLSNIDTANADYLEQLKVLSTDFAKIKSGDASSLNDLIQKLQDLSQKVKELENSLTAVQQKDFNSSTQIEELNKITKILSEKLNQFTNRETSLTEKQLKSDTVMADLRSANDAHSQQDLQQIFKEIEQSLLRLNSGQIALEEKRIEDLEFIFRRSNEAIEQESRNIQRLLLEQKSKQDLKILSVLDQQLKDDHLKAKFTEILSKDKEFSDNLAKNQNLLASLNQGLLQAIINDANFRLAFIGAVKDHPEFIKALSSGLATQLGSDQTLRESLIRDPNFIAAFFEKKELIHAMAKDETLHANLVKTISENTTFAEAIAKDPNLAKAIAANSLLAQAMAKDESLRVNLVKTISEDKAFAEAVAKDPNLAKAIAANPLLAQAMAKDESLRANLVKTISEDKAFAGAIAKDPNLAKAIAQSTALSDAIARESAFRSAITKAIENQEFADFLAGNAKFIHQLATQQDLRRAITQDPNFMTAFLEKQDLIQAISERPEFLNHFKEMITREVQLKLTELEKKDETTLETSTGLKSQVVLLQQAFTDFTSSANLEDLKRRWVAVEHRLDGVQKSSLESNFEILSKIDFLETRVDKYDFLIFELMNLLSKEKLEIFKYLVQIQTENESTNNQLRMDHNNLASKHRNLDERFMRSGAAVSSPDASPNQNRTNSLALSIPDIVKKLENEPSFKELLLRLVPFDRTPSARTESPADRNSSNNSREEKIRAFRERISGESSPSTGDYIEVKPLDVVRFLKERGSNGSKYGLKEDQGSLLIRKDKVVQLYDDFNIAGAITNFARAKKKGSVDPMAITAGLHPDDGKKLLTDSPSKQLALDSTQTPARRTF
jgi:protein-arginine kinase activator protein McsA